MGTNSRFGAITVVTLALNESLSLTTFVALYREEHLLKYRIMFISKYDLSAENEVAYNNLFGHMAQVSFFSTSTCKTVAAEKLCQWRSR